MGHHFVPRAYLRAFAVAGAPGEMVWTYPRGDSARLASINKVAQSRGYYSPEAESDLNRLVEIPANSVLASLRAGKPINGHEKQRMALYIATMMHRVPRNRERARALAPKALSETVDDIRRDLLDLDRIVPLPPGRLDKLLKDLEVARVKFELHPPHEVVESPWPSGPVIEALRRMSWRILGAPTDESFVTSDNPAYYFESFGVGRKESEVILPLSPSKCLHCCWQRIQGGDVGNVNATRELVREMNRRVISGATRLAFSHQKAGWLGAMLMKPAQEASHLNRITWTDSPGLVEYSYAEAPNVENPKS